jgi:hypothetical protein
LSLGRLIHEGSPAGRLVKCSPPSDRHSHPVTVRLVADLAYSAGWGYGPGGLLGTVLIIILILALLGRV